MDRLRAFLSARSLPLLIGQFLGVLTILGAMLGLAFTITRNSSEPSNFFYWWVQSLLALLAYRDVGVVGESTLVRNAAEVATGVLGLILPALFVGGVVLKLFSSPQMIVARNSIAVVANDVTDVRFNKPDFAPHHLRLRFYSGSPFTLLCLTFTVVLETEQRDSDGGVVLVNTELALVNPQVPQLRQHVPQTVLVPLTRGDIANRDEVDILESVQGHQFGELDVLRLLVSGTIPDLGIDFRELHEYQVSKAVSFDGFGGIMVDRSVPASRWLGWANFDA